MCHEYDGIFPKVVVFDLDGTLWNPEMYELGSRGGTPFHRHTDEDTLIDCNGTHVQLIGETRAVLVALTNMMQSNKRNKNSSWPVLAIASTCDEPTWAKECLRLFRLSTSDTLSRKEESFSSIFAGFDEIYGGCRKTHHFGEILRKAQEKLPNGSSVAFKDFLFFDNQRDNVEHVSKLGVCCVYCPRGLEPGVWDRGLEVWRSNNNGANI